MKRLQLYQALEIGGEFDEDGDVRIQINRCAFYANEEDLEEIRDHINALLAKLEADDV